MIAEGQIVAFRFPHTDDAPGKLRPALVLRRLPGAYDDWLICMVSSRAQQALADLDEVIGQSDPDFAVTGLKTTSVVRITRVAVVEAGLLQGRLGQVSEQRLQGIRRRFADWLTASAPGRKA